MENLDHALDETMELFETQIKRVLDITTFDSEIILPIIKNLEDLSHRLENKLDNPIENPRFLPKKEIRSLKLLINAGSMQPKYIHVYNQCIVLFVSHFAATLNSIFCLSLTHKLNSNDELDDAVRKEEIKFSISDLKKLDFNISEEIGTVIVDKHDISFQDMKSIKRVFKTWLNVSIEKDVDADNIITAQALRHAIVHNGEKTNKSTLYQLSSAPKRTYYKDAVDGSDIKMDINELHVISQSMISYVRSLIKNTKSALQTAEQAAEDNATTSPQN